MTAMEVARKVAFLGFAERLAQIGSWEWNLDSGELSWSDNLFCIFGLEPGELTPTPAYVLARTHPDDRERVARRVDAARVEGRLPPLEYRIVRDDGSLRHLRATLAVAEADEYGPRRLVGAVQDLSDQRRAEREIAAHVAVAQVLTDWESFESGSTQLLWALGEALDFGVGVLWVVDEDTLTARVLVCPAPLESNFGAATRRARLRRGADVPGRAWQERSPIRLRTLQDGPRSPRRDAAAEAGLVSAVALPAIDRDDVLAVLEFYSRRRLQISERLVDSLTGIGHEIGQFLGRRRGELRIGALTQRELEVLQAAAHGNAVREIAETLVISPATVKSHLENIYAKLGVSDRAAAVARGLRDGLIQ